MTVLLSRPTSSKQRVNSQVAEMAGTAKQAYVRRMFARISARYDLLNSVLTLGQDRRWRRMAVSLLGSASRGRILDVGTGTGELALEAARHGRQVVGVDFSPQMLSLGRAKVKAQGWEEAVQLVLGDALVLPFRDESFAGSITGFALRNVTSVEQLLAEIWRVVKPGGRLVCLELTRPRTTWWGRVSKWYFDHVIPILGRMLSGDREAYDYLPRSLAQFPASADLAQEMQRVGWRQVCYHSVGAGLVALHAGVKEGSWLD